MSRFRHRRVTTPPRVVPLLPIAFVGIVVAALVVDVLAGVFVAVQLPFVDGAPRYDLGAGSLALEIAIDVVLLVVASLVLRWLVRRWVGAQRPDPPLAR